MLKIGLVGFSQGYYATVYSMEAARTRDVIVPVVCDLGRDEAYIRECAGVTAAEHAHRLGAQLVHRLEDVLEAGLDAVIITSEIAEHAEHAVACLNAGLHVFVGKPISWKPEDIHYVAAAARRTGKIVLPGQPARYEEGLRRAHARLRAGEIGTPWMFRVMVNHPAMVDQAWQRDPERSGGPVGEFATYAVDILRWMAGEEPTEVFAYGGSYRHPELGEPDGVKGLIRFPSGAIGSFDLYCCLDYRYPFLELEVAGSEGVLRCDYHNYQVQIYRGGIAHLDEPRYTPMNQWELQHFIALIRGEAEPMFTLDDALRTAETVAAVRESLRIGQPVPVSPQGAAPWR